ncbi:hypothetical protein B0H66DRAFT_604203 [Apodospora peruviana]|uniref:Uncharacterized protein n=1 Tax=Apodospora peruviana TaxID=516989 RepID=A0AAE0HZW7_9PEZI|nr:hypothetical protein B0H66DRAFT_604203 [Apodospora peruviana]
MGSLTLTTSLANLAGAIGKASIAIRAVRGDTSGNLDHISTELQALNSTLDTLSNIINTGSIALAPRNALRQMDGALQGWTAVASGQSGLPSAIVTDFGNTSYSTIKANARDLTLHLKGIWSLEWAVRETANSQKELLGHQVFGNMELTFSSNDARFALYSALLRMATSADEHLDMYIPPVDYYMGRGVKSFGERLYYLRDNNSRLPPQKWNAVSVIRHKENQVVRLLTDFQYGAVHVLVILLYGPLTKV